MNDAPPRAITRRDFLARAGGAATLCFAPIPRVLAAQVAIASSSRPMRHVCLMVAEDMGLQIGPYGDTAAPTPSLDRLAAMGATFDRAYCSSPTCSPSRSSIFTGLYPHQNGHYGLAGQWGYRLHEGVPTLPAVLKRAGFANGLTYKIHVDPEASLPFDRHYKWKDFHDAGTSMLDGRMIARFTGDFFRQHERQRVFFMPQSTDTHRPFTQKDGSHHRLLREAGAPYRIVTPDEGLLLPYFGPDIAADQRLRQDVADYYNAVQRVDLMVGEVLDQLERLGLLDETLVIFTSDHGPPFGRGKLSLYDFGAHVPLIVRWPGVTEPGQRVAQPVSLIDTMPTILDATGVAHSGYMQGRSWRDVITGSPHPQRSPFVVAEYHAHMTVSTYWPGRTITDGRWKLIWNLFAGESDGGMEPDNPSDTSPGRNSPEGSLARAVYRRFDNPPRFELYDLASDPHELHDLSGDAAARLEAARLLDALADWQARTADPFADADFLDRFTRHYRAREQAAYAWSKEHGKPFWGQPVLHGDQRLWLREWSQVEPELIDAAAHRRLPHDSLLASHRAESGI